VTGSCPWFLFVGRAHGLLSSSWPMGQSFTPVWYDQLGLHMIMWVTLLHLSHIFCESHISGPFHTLEQRIY
jgi:hypothetical protein